MLITIQTRHIVVLGEEDNLSEVVRMFIAVDIEDPSIISKLVRIRDSFVATGAPMKPVEDHNMHITLRFLGNTPLSLLDDLERIVREARPKKVKLHLYGVGAFPTPTRPRVLWVGVREGAEELERIYRVIERGVRRLGFKPEREEFVAHITLARLKGSRNLDRVVKLLNELQDVDVGYITLESVRIKQSILTRSGPIYKTLREIPAEE